ncbi:MAG: hypothetical protein IT363_06015 [Methanoregulaceae archaeon]|nr:hypothetical protein [Methanoregulaceae archaeon]
MAITNYHTVNGEIIAETTGAVRTGYLTDGLGSVTGTQGSTGNVLATYRYKPYGALLAKTGVGSDPLFLWTGVFGSRSSTRTFAEQYNRARHLASPIGSWTSKDPLWPGQWAHVYVSGNPVTHSDPSGLQHKYCTGCKSNDPVCNFPAGDAQLMLGWDGQLSKKMCDRELSQWHNSISCACSVRLEGSVKIELRAGCFESKGFPSIPVPVFGFDPPPEVCRFERVIYTFPILCYKKLDCPKGCIKPCDIKREHSGARTEYLYNDGPWLFDYTVHVPLLGLVNAQIKLSGLTGNLTFSGKKTYGYCHQAKSTGGLL